MKIEQVVLAKALEWAYTKAISGIGAFDSAYKLADHHQKQTTSREAAVESLANWQVVKCATSGFVTGLGGLITLPLAIPANISSVLLIQLRMIVSIAIIGGFDVKGEQVKSLAFACLTGRAAGTVLKEIGITVGQGITDRVIQGISKQVMTRINYLVKIRLLTKTGKIGFLNLGKAIPI